LKKWMKGKELNREKRQSLLRLKVKGKTNLDWKRKNFEGEIVAIGSDIIVTSACSFHREELDKLELVWDE